MISLKSIVGTVKGETKPAEAGVTEDMSEEDLSEDMYNIWKEDFNRMAKKKKAKKKKKVKKKIKKTKKRR